MYTYDFTWIDLSDDYNDEYQSNDHKSLSEAKKAWTKILISKEGQAEILETWIHKDGEYLGRW